MATCVSNAGPEVRIDCGTIGWGSCSFIWCSGGIALWSWHQPSVPPHDGCVWATWNEEIEAYHPQCNGMIECFNRALKSLLWKHAAQFGTNWNKYLSGVLWATRNTPHESTGEKPLFLLFGIDCWGATEAALLPTNPIEPVEVNTYREEVIKNLSSAHKLAVKSLQEIQKKSKVQYDVKATDRLYIVGDWILVKFSKEESGRNWKLSQPWHGPYRVISWDDPDLTISKVYQPQDGTTQIH